MSFFELAWYSGAWMFMLLAAICFILVFVYFVSDSFWWSIPFLFASITLAVISANTLRDFNLRSPWKCNCGAVNTGNYCEGCGHVDPRLEWDCVCGAHNVAAYCMDCGTSRRDAERKLEYPNGITCPECSAFYKESDQKYCGNCGALLE